MGMADKGDWIHLENVDGRQWGWESMGMWEDNGERRRETMVIGDNGDRRQFGLGIMGKGVNGDVRQWEWETMVRGDNGDGRKC